MPDYAKVVNGEVTEIGPEPESWTNPDGSTTTTPAGVESSPAVLKKAGYLPVEDRYEETGDNQIHGNPSLEVLKTKVVRTFPAEDLPTPEPDPLADRVTELDQRLMQVEVITQHYKPIIDDWSQAGPVHEMDARALWGSYQALRGRMSAIEERLAALEGGKP